MDIKNVDEIKKLVIGSDLLGKSFECTYNSALNCVGLLSNRKPFLYEARVVDGTLKVYIPMSNSEGPSIEEEPYPYVTGILLGTIKIEENQ